MSDEILTGIFIGVPVGVIVALIIASFKNILNFFKNITLRFYKKKIEKKFKIIAKETNDEVGIEILPKIKLQIVSGEEKIDDIGKNIVLYLNKSNKHQDFSKLLCLILENNFLVDMRRHIDPKLYDSSKYTLGKSILTKNKKRENLSDENKEHLKYFNRTMNEILQDDNIIELIHKQELLLVKRLFKTVFLHELEVMGDRLVTETPYQECKKESLEFLEFLHNIADKDNYQVKHGVEPSLQFKGKFFKLAVILIKKQTNYTISNHLKAISYIMENREIPIIYIMGWGKNNCELIEKHFIKILDNKISSSYHNKWFRYKELQYEVKGRGRYHDVPGLCYIYKKS